MPAKYFTKNDVKWQKRSLQLVKTGEKETPVNVCIHVFAFAFNVIFATIE